MYSPLRHVGSVIWKQRPIQLTFFLTRKCNARCPFCFYLNSADHETTHEPELTLEEIRTITPSLGKLLWLAFSGGEIYLRKDLVEISEVFYRQNQPAIMLFPTNGLLPQLIFEQTEQILQRCPESIIVVKLSVDGLNGDHDALRRTPGGFEHVMESYRLLEPLLDRYPNFELGINTVFCSENQDKMNDIIDFTDNLKRLRTHTVSLARGNLSFPEFKHVDEGKYLQTVKRLEKNYQKKNSSMYQFNGGRIKAAQDIVQRHLIHKTMQTKRRQLDCYAGRLNLVLTESGDVYPCEILDACMGNVRDYHYDMRELSRSKTARNILDSIQVQQCYCTHECYFITNILFNPATYPRLLREYIRCD